MAKEKNLISIELTDRELDRYLDSLGLLHVYEAEYVASVTTQVFNKMQELYETDFPDLLTAKIKPSSAYFFNCKEDFDKQFIHYMKKVLLREFMQMQATHPKMSAEEISQKIIDEHIPIFNRSITYVYKDVKDTILGYKIDCGQQPFADELFSE
jgi:hypothetical protein